MTKWGDTAFTPCCKDIMVFVATATMAVNEHGYDIGFTPLQTSLALKKYANHTVRKYMSILANENYLTLIKGKSQSSSSFYSTSSKQLKKWMNDAEKRYSK